MGVHRTQQNVVTPWNETREASLLEFVQLAVSVENVG